MSETTVPAARSRLTGAVLLAANAIPLLGVALLDWDSFSIMLLFWIENVIVGVLNVLRMLVSQPKSLANWASKLFLVPFFCVHYGMFTAIHGIFVIGLFGEEYGLHMDIPDLLRVPEIFPHAELWWAVAALAASHLVSFFANFVFGGEYRTTSASMLMMRPYGRVVILHVTIIFGGAAVMALGSPVWALLLLIALKTVGDLTAHRWRNRSNSANNPQQA